MNPRPLPGWHRTRRPRRLWAVGTALTMALIGFVLTLALLAAPDTGQGCCSPQPTAAQPGPPTTP